MSYISSETNKHEFDEEHDWVKILSSGQETHGMLLVFVQKLCTAFHEYGPVYEAGIINPQDWPFISGRLIKRINKVIDVANDNDMGDLAGIKELMTVRHQFENSPEIPDLMELAEEVHQINHHICDELKN